MAAPFDFYGDPSLVLERKQEGEISCRVCIYNLRPEQKCIMGHKEYPNRADECRHWKHKEK